MTGNPFDMFGDDVLRFLFGEPLGPGDDPAAKPPKAPYQQAYDIARGCHALTARTNKEQTP